MEPTNSVLIIEDENPIAELLHMTLKDAYFSSFGLSIEKVSSCEQARFLLKNKNYDLLLLDWMLPGEQGIDFLKSIMLEKKDKSSLEKPSVLMLTAKVDADSIVQGLEAGAEDYVTKPFDFQVLKARIKSILVRREQMKKMRANTPLPAHEEVIHLKGLALDFNKVEVNVQGEFLHLTPSEFKLLGFLLKSKGRVLTRDQLIDLIQGQDVTVTGRTIDTHIFALRKKLGTWADYIETIRGVGYRVLFD